MFLSLVQTPFPIPMAIILCPISVYLTTVKPKINMKKKKTQCRMQKKQYEQNEQLSEKWKASESNENKNHFD